MSNAAPAKTASVAPTIKDHSREKSIEFAPSAITKQFREGSIMRLGDAKKMTVETLSTGSIAIDLGLRGGSPRGRHIEVNFFPGRPTYRAAS